MSQTTAVQARYQVIARIASGGMGEVFRARDSVLARDVAIKVLHRNLAGDPGFIDRFRREARAAALLSHPNIVAVHDWGSTRSGTYFMVMEFVRGRTVRDLLAGYGKLEPQQAIEVLLQMLAALDHAHARGIVHRDVKPENVLVTPDGVVKVADFGLARAFAESRVSQAPGTVTGTVQYLAPEQIQGDPADPRTDLYATGVVAYELLTGMVPFTGETSLAIAYKHLSNRIPEPSRLQPAVPAPLDRVVMHATEKEPDLRPASAAEMRKELVAAAVTVPVAKPLAELVRGLPAKSTPSDERASTVTIPRTVAPAVRRRRLWRRVATALVVLAALAGSAWAAWVYVIPHYTHVPKVIGLTGDAARHRLDRDGLDTQFGPSDTSTTIPKGEVLGQSVAPGTKVRKGTQVTITLSAGLPVRSVLDVRGERLAVATAALHRLGLHVNQLHAFSSTVPKGSIIDQSPEAPTRIQFGSTVTLTVSDGPRPVDVPTLIGRSAADAKAILSAAQFHVVAVRQFSLSVPAGNVIDQRPSSGKIAVGSTITLIVSKGPRTFSMPRVLNMSESSARSLLEGDGLHVVTIVIPGSTGDTVRGQIPDPGVTVQEGQTVRIYVA